MDGYGCENSRSSKTSFRILSTDVNDSTLELSTPLNAKRSQLFPRPTRRRTTRDPIDLLNCHPPHPDHLRVHLLIPLPPNPRAHPASPNTNSSKNVVNRFQGWIQRELLHRRRRRRRHHHYHHHHHHHYHDAPPVGSVTRGGASCAPTGCPSRRHLSVTVAHSSKHQLESQKVFGS